MSNKIFLVAPVFHFVYLVEKDSKRPSQDDTKLCQLQQSVNKFPDAV